MLVFEGSALQIWRPGVCVFSLANFSCDGVDGCVCLCFMCVLVVLYVGVGEGSAFWGRLRRWMHQCPTSSVLVSVCGIHTEIHCWLNLQRGKQLPSPLVWDGETFRYPGTQGWPPGAGQEESPGPRVQERQ